MGRKVVLRRLAYEEVDLFGTLDRTFGTLGLLQLGSRTLRTVERPFIPGERGWGVPFESCVPAGLYDVVKRQSPSKGLRYHLFNPDLGVFLEADDRTDPLQRYACMFHVANRWDEVQGCIGVGLNFHDFGVRGWGVGSSLVGTTELETLFSELDVTQLEIDV